MISRGLLPSLALAAVACAGASRAQAQDASTLNLRALAATCANCHGSGGRAIPNSAVPGLAGMPGVYMLEQMKAFKSGARVASVMQQITKGFSDAQLDQLAAFFAAQPK